MKAPSSQLPVGRPGIDHIGVGVGAAIFNDHNQVLLTLRGKAAKNEVGTWEIPGGAVEFGETFAQALKREVKEELAVDIEVGELVNICDHLIPDEHQHWVSPTYLCTITSGQPTIMEPEKCEEIGWFTLDEAEKLPLSLVTKDDVVFLRSFLAKN